MSPMIPGYGPLEKVVSTIYCTIYKSTIISDPDFHQLVAVKQTFPEEEGPPHSSKHELALLLRFQSHPNLVKLLDHSTISTDLYETSQFMIFPWYQTDLIGFLKHHSKLVKRKRDLFNAYLNLTSSSVSSDQIQSKYENQLTEIQSNSILHGIASALEYIHNQGIIHRDIKPSNIMFKSYQDSTPILIDFGISYDLDNSAFRHQDEFNPLSKFSDICTSIYKPPEVIFGIRSYGTEIDIWSFGIVMTILYSTDLKTCIMDEDEFSGDIGLLFSLIVWFGRPTLKNWPEGKESSTFMNMFVGENDKNTVEEENFEMDLDKLIPRASDKVRNIFRRMMIYQSSNRISATEIAQLIN